MPDHACRLAQAETEIKNIHTKFDAHAQHEHQQLEEIKDSIREIQQTIETNKGFIRGVSFTITALAGAIGMGLHWLTNGGQGN